MANEYDFLMHHGIRGQRWGIRRYQNEDGTLTAEGREHYLSGNEQKKFANKIVQSTKQLHGYKRIDKQYEKAKHLPQIVNGAKKIKNEYEEVRRLRDECDKMRGDFEQLQNPEYHKYLKKYAQEISDNRKKLDDMDYPVDKIYKDLQSGELFDGHRPWRMYLGDHQKEKSAYDKLSSDANELLKKVENESRQIASEFLGSYANATVHNGCFDETSNKMLKDKAANLIKGMADDLVTKRN